MSPAEVTLKSEIPEIIAVTEAGTQRATQESAIRIVAGCKSRSRIASGAMKAGWQSRRAPGINTYEVFNPVYYTIFNEYGTINMSAQPMLAPSVEDERHKFPEEVKAVWEGLAFGSKLLSPGGRFTGVAESRSPGSVFT